jgi:cytochrome b561
MKENILRKENTAMDYLGYALYAFGGLGLEILLMMIETSFWGVPSGSWTIKQHIIHWSITCLIWGVIGLTLLKQSIKIRSKIKKVNWFMAGTIIIISIVYTSITWNGFKPAIELSNNGIVKFIVQYLYYAVESLLILLIIAHGQMAFEKCFKNMNHIPFGALLLAMTWGIIHILTQGMATGIYACIQSLLFGCIYLVLNKDIKYSYLAIAFMFML